MWAAIWNPTAVRIEEAVDEMEIARPAAPGGNRDLTCDRSLSSRRECRSLLMADVFPGDSAVPAQRVGEAVQRVPREPVDAADPGQLESFDDVLGNGRHDPLLLVVGRVRAKIGAFEVIDSDYRTRMRDRLATGLRQSSLPSEPTEKRTSSGRGRPTMRANSSSEHT
jgi:hypothetical protein